MIPPVVIPENCAAFVIANPLSGTDHQLAAWFHARLTDTFATVLEAFSEPGSAEWIGGVLAVAVLFLIWKKSWPALVTLLLTVPGGMLLNELLKLAVHRQRPFLEGPFVDWSGYSFASGHTIGATLLYGQLAVFLVPVIKKTRARLATVFSAMLLVLLVGFSRIALGAHYLTDVLAAMVFGVSWLALALIVADLIRRHHLRPKSPAENLTS